MGLAGLQCKVYDRRFPIGIPPILFRTLSHFSERGWYLDDNDISMKMQSTQRLFGVLLHHQVWGYPPPGLTDSRYSSNIILFRCGLSSTKTSSLLKRFCDKNATQRQLIQHKVAAWWLRTSWSVTPNPLCGRNLGHFQSSSSCNFAALRQCFLYLYCNFKCPDSKAIFLYDV